MIYFFGCWERAGHYLHAVDGRQLRWAEGPWGYAIDGGLLDKRVAQVEGVAVVAQRDGWTAVSFWDRSVDKRQGSNAAFLVDELVTGEELLARARVAFPTIFARFTFPVVLTPRT